jgi:hypothetical protein
VASEVKRTKAGECLGLDTIANKSRIQIPRSSHSYNTEKRERGVQLGAAESDSASNQCAGCSRGNLHDLIYGKLNIMRCHLQSKYARRYKSFGKYDLTRHAPLFLSCRNSVDFKLMICF